MIVGAGGLFAAWVSAGEQAETLELKYGKLHVQVPIVEPKH